MTVRHDHSHAANGAAVFSLASLLRVGAYALAQAWDAAETLYQRLEAREGVRQMLDLDDHLLRDMGVTRADVLQAVNLPLSCNAGAHLARASRRNARQ